MPKDINNESKILLDIQFNLMIENNTNQQRHNFSVTDELVVNMLDQKTRQPTQRDIQLQVCGIAQNFSEYKCINQNHALYIELHYVLLFFHGNPSSH